jgi:hypothetical protein
MVLMTDGIKSKGRTQARRFVLVPCGECLTEHCPKCFVIHTLPYNSAAGISIVRQAKAEYQQTRCSRA